LHVGRTEGGMGKAAGGIITSTLEDKFEGSRSLGGTGLSPHSSDLGYLRIE
jgi:hypothetical protein